MRKTKNIWDNKLLSMTNYLFLPSSAFLLILTCSLWSFSVTKPAVATTPQPIPTTKVVLTPGMTGSEVQVLQIQLKALGLYEKAIDGQYGISTKNAVIQFQKAKGLDRVDGIADISTQNYLTQIISGQVKLKTSTDTKSPENLNTNIADKTNNNNSQVQTTQKKEGLIWWSLLGLGILGTIGSVTYLIKRFIKISELPKLPEQKLLNPYTEIKDNQEINLLESSETKPITIPTDLVPLDKKPLLPQLNIYDELIKDLQHDNSKTRRKAIWTLGQEGDSRAARPLLDLMLDVDSEQQSLIVSTLVEIGTRSLKPMNRALAMSIQDENPRVRKNAIRDLVRVYDMVGKMSKVVLYAMEDPDPEVQETAKYALGQINRIRSIPEQQVLTEMKTEEASIQPSAISNQQEVEKTKTNTSR